MHSADPSDSTGERASAGWTPGPARPSLLPAPPPHGVPRPLAAAPPPHCGPAFGPTPPRGLAPRSRPPLGDRDRPVAPPRGARLPEQPPGPRRAAGWASGRLSRPAQVTRRPWRQEEAPAGSCPGQPPRGPGPPRAVGRDVGFRRQDRGRCRRDPAWWVLDAAGRAGHAAAPQMRTRTRALSRLHGQGPLSSPAPPLPVWPRQVGSPPTLSDRGD